jgi:hypothetical protein
MAPLTTSRIDLTKTRYNAAKNEVDDVKNEVEDTTREITENGLKEEDQDPLKSTPIRGMLKKVDKM